MTPFPIQFFGHMIADFFCQPGWMAMEKKNNMLMCIFHCFIYTFVLAFFLLFSGHFCGIWKMLLIFLGHLLIDGTNLLDRWFKLMNIRSWDSYLPKIGDKISFGTTATNFQNVATSFGAIVYVACYSTLHLMINYAILEII